LFLTRFAVARPVTTTMIMIAIMVLGLVAVRRLSIDNMPDVELPFAFVQVIYPGANPETVEKVVIRPLEKAINTVGGLKNLTSWSRQNLGFIFIEFRLGTRLDKAVLDVKDRSAPVIAGLPREVHEVLIQQFNPTTQPILALGLSSEQYTIAELSDFANDRIVDRLQSVDGVGAVDLVGARPYEVRVEYDPRKMVAADVELKDLVETLQGGGLDIPAGVLKSAGLSYDVQLNLEPDDPLELGNLVILTRSGVPTRVGDIARVRYVPAEADSYAYLDGKPGLGIDIRKATGANTTNVADAAKRMVKNLQAQLPPGMRMEVVRDDSTFIRSSVDDVKKTLYEGAILCVLVVFFFLASWRSTVITGLTLPISIIGAFLALLILGFTLNNMTLMALSLATGLLIDDAIVVRENIVRTLRTGVGHREASLRGTAEIGPAVMATSLTVVSVFVPVAFMGGIVGRFFYSFGLTIAAAVLISLFVSFTLDPMLSAYWYDPQGLGGDAAKPIGIRAWLRWAQEGFTRRRQVYLSNLRGHLLRNVLVWPFVIPALLANALLNGLHYILVPLYTAWFAVIGLLFRLCSAFERRFMRLADSYSRAITWVLGHRSLIVLIALGAFIAAIALLPIIGAEFFPRFDRSEFQVTVSMPVGTNLETTAAFAQGVEKRCRELAETRLTYTTVSGGTSTQREASIFVKLAPRRERQRTAFEVMDALRTEVQSLAGAKISVGAGGMGAGGKSVQFFVSGARLDELDKLSTELEQHMMGVRGAVDVGKTEISGSPRFEVQPYEFPESALELRDTDVAARLNTAISGERVRSWQDPDGLDHDVVVRLPEEMRSTVTALDAMPVRASYRGMTEPIVVPLSRVARLKQSTGPAEIQRYNLQRMITVDCNVRGVPAGSVIGAARQYVKQMNLPPGYTVVEGGEAEMMKETMQNVMIALTLAILFIYFILASQFENFVHPLAIMLSLPLSLVGVALGLLVSRDTINVMSLIGLIMLMGLVTKNAILLIEFTNQLRRRGMDRTAALAQAGRIRFRPIIMTTLAMIFGMLPLALALGEGGEFRAPMARAVIGGLITSTLLTLIVVPVAYSILDDLFSGYRLRAVEERHGEAQDTREQAD
jgi:HAE1 family hydrophobic/amphiphilic exporter-1